MSATLLLFSPKCAHCGEDFPKGAQFCVRCGKPFSVAAPGSSPAEVRELRPGDSGRLPAPPPRARLAALGTDSFLGKIERPAVAPKRRRALPSKGAHEEAPAVSSVAVRAVQAVQAAEETPARPVVRPQVAPTPVASAPVTPAPAPQALAPSPSVRDEEASATEEGPDEDAPSSAVEAREEPSRLGAPAVDAAASSWDRAAPSDDDELLAPSARRRSPWVWRSVAGALTFVLLLWAWPSRGPAIPASAVEEEASAEEVDAVAPSSAPAASAPVAPAEAAIPVPARRPNVAGERPASPAPVPAPVVVRPAATPGVPGAVVVPKMPDLSEPAPVVTPAPTPEPVPTPAPAPAPDAAGEAAGFLEGE